jgi:predicted nuclease of restriction endonuclease-like (RecB) superfamily
MFFSFKKNQKTTSSNLQNKHFMENKIEKPMPLLEKIADLILAARQKVAVAVNLTMVHTYFEIGRMIVEEEQNGKQKAAYGKFVLKNLSIRLVEMFGKGFSERNLEQMRQFFLVYSIPQTVSAEFKLPRFQISWSHYLILMRIENASERSFYEIETAANNWSLRELKRQYNSSLYERLALSRNKEEVMKLATHGQQMEQPTDILKNPLTLDFLGLGEKSAYSESDLETKIISKIQQFLLELGKGFAFIGRQIRFTFDEEHYKIDLVFYNRLLRCFVLVDLKLGKLTHQDLGQMQMYVNYYDRHAKTDFEAPTIGILLCKKRNQALVELTLPENANIYASEYSLYLPDKRLLQQKLAEWLVEFEA